MKKYELSKLRMPALVVALSLGAIGCGLEDKAACVGLDCASERDDIPGDPGVELFRQSDKGAEFIITYFNAGRLTIDADYEKFGPAIEIATISCEEQQLNVDLSNQSVPFMPENLDNLEAQLAPFASACSDNYASLEEAERTRDIILQLG